MNKPLRIGVLGASGFVGSHICAQARAQGHEIVEFRAPRLKTGAREIDALFLEDLTHASHEHPTDLRDWNRVDVFVNASGLASPEGSQLDELYGAHALLVAMLSQSIEVPLLHLSSAAVLGEGRLSSTPQTRPFSPYSESKALGEEALFNPNPRTFSLAGENPGLPPRVCLRATSVQGQGRKTTQRLIRLVSSPLAVYSVDAPSPITSVHCLGRLAVGICERLSQGENVPRIVLQPWEGVSTKNLIEAARNGGKARKIPEPLARSFVEITRSLTRLPAPIGPKAAATYRRLELLFFGQDQEDSWAPARELSGAPEALALLRKLSRKTDTTSG